MHAADALHPRAPRAPRSGSPPPAEAERCHGCVQRGRSVWSRPHVSPAPWEARTAAERSPVRGLRSALVRQVSEQQDLDQGLTPARWRPKGTGGPCGSLLGASLGRGRGPSSPPRPPIGFASPPRKSPPQGPSSPSSHPVWMKGPECRPQALGPRRPGQAVSEKFRPLPGLPALPESSGTPNNNHNNNVSPPRPPKTGRSG